MLQLSLFMLERVGIIITIAFLLFRWKSFRDLLLYKDSLKDKILIVLFFGGLGIISSYIGIKIDGSFLHNDEINRVLEDSQAIANTRLIAVAIAGLFGGPFIGIGAGVISGMHRLLLGGFTAVACGVSTMLAGVITGYFGYKLNIRKTFSYRQAILIGVCTEMLQMVLILIMAKPYDLALNLVQIIAVPMIIMNAFGIFIFCLIIKTSMQEQEKARASQTHEAFYIAQRTLPFFRQGLNRESCKRVAKIICEEANVIAVAITNQEEILAHVGEGEDHHLNNRKIMTKITHEVLKYGRIRKAKSKKEIGCEHGDCSLQAAIVMPLMAHQTTVGTLKMYFQDEASITTVEEELADGLSKLFSSQLEYAEVEMQRKLLRDAEIKALQAQIHPHFFFNSLNTISSLIRLNPDKARELLLHLSAFFRANIQGSREILIPIRKELEHVEAFLAIEQTRFPKRYHIVMDIDESLYSYLIPPFTLQPLIENAVTHAFKEQKERNITLTIQKKQDFLFIEVNDNGQGISSEKLKILGDKTVDSSSGTGTALWNISQRIKEIYGSKGSFQIVSKVGAGTKIIIRIPHQFDRG